MLLNDALGTNGFIDKAITGTKIKNFLRPEAKDVFSLSNT